MFDDFIDPLARKILRRKRIEGVGASDQGDAIFLNCVARINS
jgi:hypothetical protein